MNSLLRSDFEQVDKNLVKKLRRKIIQQILFIRKKTRFYDYKTIYNFSYFHLLFSLIFLIIPFIFFIFKINQILDNEKNNLLQNFLEEKLNLNKQIKFIINNSTIINKNYLSKYDIEDLEQSNYLNNTYISNILIKDSNNSGSSIMKIFNYIIYL